jgi:4-hydroxy-3-polyprenylbenzoate decarboxylase
MGTVGRICSGVASDLIERCADVHLKEHRTLLVVPREMPFNLIHLRNLTALAEAGARIAAPIPAWYTQPTSLEEMIDFLVIRLFDGLDEDLAPLKRWEGPIQ